MHKKYFFFDIDGTLTNRETKEVVPSARVALKKLKEAGHFVAIATGRAHYKAVGFMHDVELSDMVCAGGGALVIDDQLIHNIPLDLDKAKGVIKQAEELGYGVLLMLDDSMMYTPRMICLENSVVHEKNQPIISLIQLWIMMPYKQSIKYIFRSQKKKKMN